MLASTIGFAAATSYPAPFVSGGTEDSAVVYGANAATTDIVAAIDVQTDLNALVTAGTSTTASSTGESINLATSNKKLYMNSSINDARTIITDTELPTILIDGSATDLTGTSYDYTQSITLGDTQIEFGKSGESIDPIPMITIGTTVADPIYNYTLTLVKALNVSDTTNVVGYAELNMQGVNYVIGANSDHNTLYLYGSGTAASVDEGETKTVSVGDTEHTISLKGASSSTAATIIVDGIQKSVSKGSSYKFAGDFEIYVKDVYYTTKTGTLSNVDLLLGANTLHLESGSSVRQGADDTSIPKTKAWITGTTNEGTITAITIEQAAAKTKGDYLSEGDSYVDRVFGGVEVQFGGLNPALDSASRETITIDTDNSMSARITFTTDVSGIKFPMTYAMDMDKASDSSLTGINLVNEQNNTIVNMEGGNITLEDWVIINSGDKGRILELTDVPNGLSSTDKVSFEDVITGDQFEFATGLNNFSTLNIDGYTYYCALNTPGEETGGEGCGMDVATGSSMGAVTLFPRIKLKNGAWISFLFNETYIETAAGTFEGSGALINSTIYSLPGNYLLSTYENGLPWTTSAVASNQTVLTFGNVIYNATLPGDANEANLTIPHIGIGDSIVEYNKTYGPAILFQEEKTLDDDNGHVIAIPLTAEGTNPKMPAIGTPVSSDKTSFSNALQSDNTVNEGVTVYGTYVSRDSDDNNVVTISYPDEQMQADILLTEVGATVTAGTTGGGGQVLVVKDSQISTVSSKNLIVVGGSCINTVAAKILDSDSPICTADFTTKTGVGAGQYIIKTVTSPYDEDQIAMLVAGYAAADTVNAVNKALEGVTSDVGTEQVYPIVSA